jgi:hypothetical protein
MGLPGIILAVVVACTVVGFVLWRFGVARTGHHRRKAVGQFPVELARLEDPFLAAANATGKPRGLRWIAAKLTGDPVFALDRANGELYALVAATIGFEAIAGGGMEEVDAVGNLREATAVFAHRAGQWTTDGRAVFNLDPAAALDHYRESLQPYLATA